MADEEVKPGAMGGDDDQSMDADLASVSVRKKRFNIKQIIVIVVLLIVIPVGSYYLVKTLLMPGIKEKIIDKTVIEKIDKKEKEVKIGPIIELDPIVVNLAGTEGRRYVKVTANLELDMHASTQEFEDKKTIIKDILISILSSKTIDDVDEMLDKNKIRREIITKVNDVINSGKVVNVYFTDFLIQ